MTKICAAVTGRYRASLWNRLHYRYQTVTSEILQASRTESVGPRSPWLSFSSILADSTLWLTPQNCGAGRDESGGAAAEAKYAASYHASVDPFAAWRTRCVMSYPPMKHMRARAFVITNRSRVRLFVPLRCSLECGGA